MHSIVLASGSLARQRMLRAVGLQVHAEASGVDERALQESLQASDPVEVAQALARAKAAAVAERWSRAIVIGADQVIWDGSEVIGKPDSPTSHLQRLRSMRGKTHELYTAWCVLGPGGVERSGVTRTRLSVRADLSDAELAAYVATKEGAPCAGGYAIEGHGAWLFERVEGDWNNVLGLPLFDVLGVLRDLGLRYGGPDV